jgi:deoxyribonuclease (pyrimidine dimer)
MTRINAGVRPSELSRQHLIAEHREITRIPNAVKSGRCSFSGIPSEFKLGEGHVKFFYRRLLYLKKRYQSLLDECKERNYNVTDKTDAFNDLPNDCFNDWEETPAARELILARIKERL